MPLGHPARHPSTYPQSPANSYVAGTFLIQCETAIPETKAEPSHVIHKPLISYWMCKRRLRTLHKYQDLIRHRERMMHFLQFARPIEKLIPPFKDALEREHYLDTEIARLTPIVCLILREVGLSTTFTRTVSDPQVGPSPTKQEPFDIITRYLHVPLGSLDAKRIVDPLMTLLDEGIGMYLARQENARREFFYPTVWLAYIVRLPITVLIRAGILPSGQFVSNIYGKIIYFLIILARLYRVSGSKSTYLA